MLARMNPLADAGISSLNGWEISGIVVVLIIAGFALWMLPEFIRYLKIRSM